MRFKVNFFILAIVVLATSGVFYFFYSNNLISDPISILGFIEQFKGLSYLVFFLLILLEVIVAPIPGAVLYAIGGALFGTVIGGTIGLVANIFGSALAYYIGDKIVIEKKSERMMQLDHMVEKYGGYALFFLRINPFTSSDAFSYLAGIVKMDFKKFIVGTTLGLIPLIYLQSYFGGFLLETNNIISTIFIFACAIYLAVFIYLLFDKNLVKWIKEKLFHN